MADLSEPCPCGGRIVPETCRGVEHRICTSCHRCDVCDRKTEPETTE